MLKSLVPVFRSRPKLENQPGPRRQMVGETATDSTLLTVVGHPKRPTAAGNGGLTRGFPCLPSMDSISAVSSPQMYAPPPLGQKYRNRIRIRKRFCLKDRLGRLL